MAKYSRRHLLARLPALGAVLAGVTTLKPKPAIPWTEVQTEARAQGFGAAELALVSNRRLSPEAEGRAVAKLQANGVIPGEPYQGPDNGPALSPASAADLEPGNWVSGTARRYDPDELDAALARFGQDGAAWVREHSRAEAGRET